MFLLLICVFSFGIPAVVATVKFDMLSAFTALPTEHKWSIVGAVVLLILSVAFFRQIRKLFSKMEFSLFKVVILGIYRIILMVSVLIIFSAFLSIADDLIYIYKCVVYCNIPVLLYFLPCWEHYNYKVKRAIRIAETSEGVRSALK